MSMTDSCNQQEKRQRNNICEIADSAIPTNTLQIQQYVMQYVIDD
jgi:hypothetical protein